MTDTEGGAGNRKIEILDLPPKRPNLNAFAGRAVRTPREECFDRMTFFGERAVQHAAGEFLRHYHAERNHQGLGNNLILPRHPPPETPVPPENVACTERLGGLLKFYHQAAA